MEKLIYDLDRWFYRWEVADIVNKIGWYLFFGTTIVFYWMSEGCQCFKPGYSIEGRIFTSIFAGLFGVFIFAFLPFVLIFITLPFLRAVDKLFKGIFKL